MTVYIDYDFGTYDHRYTISCCLEWSYRKRVQSLGIGSHADGCDPDDDIYRVIHVNVVP
jgi:hypothetical protein